MPRIDAADEHYEAGEAHDLLRDVRRRFGSVPSMFSVLATAPPVLRAYFGLRDPLDHGRLDAAERERVALLVSERNGCSYCLSAHHFVATRILGVDSAEAERARHAMSDDPRAQALLTFTAALLDTAGDVDDAQLAAARAAGLTDAELLELVAHVALSTLTNLANRLAQPTNDWPVVVRPVTDEVVA